MLYGLLLVVQVIVALALIALILMQHGKGADAGAAFGSGASSTVFGARGSANFLSRTTGILATVFFLNSLGLAYLVSNQPEPTSVIDRLPAIEQPAPERPEPVEPGAPADVPR
jgi:preprotein translocase subunit SecG